MKQLRILTGLHAGAQLTLSHQQYTISHEESADVQITDWQYPKLVLTVNSDLNVVELAMENSNDSGSGKIPEKFEDFMPARFGDIVLCCGPVDKAWPSDLDLMSKLLRKPKVKPDANKAETKPEKKLGLRAVALSLIACGVLLIGVGGVVGHTANTAQAKAPQIPLSGRVANALVHNHIEGVYLRQAGSKVVVEGLLPTSADVLRVRAALQQFTGDEIIHKYAAASDLVQSINDALSNPNLHVNYRGHGVFSIDGETRDVEKTRQAAQRIASDLGPLVKRIEVIASGLPAPEIVSVDSMMASDEVQYVQTRDGTKHITLTTPVNVVDPYETH